MIDFVLLAIGRVRELSPEIQFDEAPSTIGLTKLSMILFDYLEYRVSCSDLLVLEWMF